MIFATVKKLFKVFLQSFFMKSAENFAFCIKTKPFFRHFHQKFFLKKPLSAESYKNYSLPEKFRKTPFQNIIKRCIIYV